MQIRIIAFLGMWGGQVAKMVDVSVIVPSDEYGPIENIHMMFDHLITAYLRSWLAEAGEDVG
jgi:D-sedoheptulose 7-phosphate isomerase